MPNDTEALIRHRVGIVKQNALALQLGKSTTQVNRIFSGDAGIMLADLDDFLGALGLVVVESSEYQVIRSMAAKYLIGSGGE